MTKVYMLEPILPRYSGVKGQVFIVSCHVLRDSLVTIPNTISTEYNALQGLVLTNCTN